MVSSVLIPAELNKSPANRGLLRPPASYRRSLTSASLHHTSWTGTSPVKCLANIQCNQVFCVYLKIFLNMVCPIWLPSFLYCLQCNSLAYFPWYPVPGFKLTTSRCKSSPLTTWPWLQVNVLSIISYSSILSLEIAFLGPPNHTTWFSWLIFILQGKSTSRQNNDVGIKTNMWLEVTSIYFSIKYIIRS